MIAINIVAANLSENNVLILSMLCLAIGIVFTYLLPTVEQNVQATDAVKPVSDIRKPVGILFLFVAIITENSGLM